MACNLPPDDHVPMYIHPAQLWLLNFSDQTGNGSAVSMTTVTFMIVDMDHTQLHASVAKRQTGISFFEVLIRSAYQLPVNGSIACDPDYELMSKCFFA